MQGATSVKTCPKCGAVNVGNLANCLRCQAPLVAQAPPPAAPVAPRAFCIHCGAPIRPGNAFCTSCGRPQAAPAAAPVTGLVCPHCRAVSPPGNRFCTSCGRPLGGAPAAPRA